MSDNERQSLQQLIRNLPKYGVRITDLARELSVHPATLYNYMRGYNIPESRAKQILTVLKDKYYDRVYAGLEGLERPNSDDSLNELFSELGIVTGGNENG